MPATCCFALESGHCHVVSSFICWFQVTVCYHRSISKPTPCLQAEYPGQVCICCCRHVLCVQTAMQTCPAQPTCCLSGA